MTNQPGCYYCAQAAAEAAAARIRSCLTGGAR